MHVGEVEAGRIDDVDSIGADEWLAIAPHLDMFEAVAIDGGPATVNLSRANEVKRYDGGLIDAQILPMLGVRPQLGVLFSTDDDTSDRRAVILGHALWQQRFGADPGIIGRSIDLDEGQRIVIGVLQPGVTWGGTSGVRPYDLWLPLSSIAEQDRADNNRNLDCIAVLRPA